MAYEKISYIFCMIHPKFKQFHRELAFVLPVFQRSTIRFRDKEVVLAEPHTELGLKIQSGIKDSEKNSRKADKLIVSSRHSWPGT